MGQITVFTLWQKVILSYPYIYSVYGTTIGFYLSGYSVKRLYTFNGSIGFTYFFLGFYGFHYTVKKYMATIESIKVATFSRKISLGN